MLLSLMMACATEASTPDPSQTLTPAELAAQDDDGHLHDGQNPPGPDCKTSCSTGDKQMDVHLANEDIAVYLADWNEQPVGEATLDLETLLFYFHDTERALEELETVPLDAEHRAFLEQELARDTVTVEMRLVDDQGIERGHMGPLEIPLKVKQHLVFEGTGSLKHLETGGKVKRVGLAHLWSRW